ncbi:energy-coupling factor transporter transmembrane component T family protein [Priestia koreensis]|uniref:energy-coupling factor transporter transmembrane component T family protein n=1 Tax=Priestia koreensis TaxID=284581 RepID=UPI001F59DA64|nr:energy-coupling factor transporter transmembrane protein EcfT [Priestia koreensis]MCM3006748.1 energy-coupling factor transporter transmembrane protein EcfT [Priestia koreensis]UNL85162.1 energy-coupling factor transporter transmembrane protein EcfT [Priestia koreensis]
MLDSVIIGRYVPGNSPLHRMDPRAKLLLVFFFVVIVFLANSTAGYGLLLLYTALLVAMSRVPLSYFLKGLKPVVFIAVFTFLIQIFLNKEGDVLLKWGWLTIYEEGLRQGIYISLRFFLLVSVTTLLTLTTTPIQVTDGMESLLNPLKKVRFPVHELALMMSISLRFIPTLLDETQKIMKAQTARGVDISSGPFKDRMKAVVPLLVPLFISAFKRAEELSIAMEARGYKGGEGRTKFRQLQWQAIDTIMLVSLLVVTLLLIVIRYF